MSIKDLDEYCRLRDKCIIVRKGKEIGMGTGYYLGARIWRMT